MSTPLSRRAFTAHLLRASSAILAAPAAVRGQPSGPALASTSRPRIEFGVASGDVTADAAVIWSRSDRASRLVVEWDTREAFRDPRRLMGPVVGPESDFTGKLVITDLPAGTRVFYRVQFEGPGGPKEASVPVAGQFVTASREARDVLFAWSGDTCGQGFGIDVTHGGLLTYDSIRRLQPQFFVHSGDMIYADNPLLPALPLPDGSLWRNVVIDEKQKVAESLSEFRGNFRYNLLDAHVRAMHADVPVFAQWDDHEVRNNWYPGQKLLEDPRYSEKNVDVLMARARQAFFEYVPVQPSAEGRIHRQISRGPLCDLFFLDLRSYRGANNANLQSAPGPDAALLGDVQLAWLEEALRTSTARWKIICCDMPLGLLIGDGIGRWEACANGEPGIPLGRELEIARLLRALKKEKIRNVFWITADVHYAAAHYYDPADATFTEFDPFWEFVSGPLHAGTFGPGTLDKTFGPSVRWRSREADAVQGVSPAANEQYFGTVAIDARSEAATVTQYNRVGTKLWSIELSPI